MPRQRPALAMVSSAGTRLVDWKAYKQAAALPFEVLDCEVAVEKTVEGNRAEHRIDVWIQAQQYGVKTRWLIDCRHWDTPITKADVFALKQVMKDIKGDRALMLSNAGFDSGATKAARSTSITLTTLEAIQDSAELELTRTTLISLENRITKLKQSLERLSESVQVAPGIWQSQPKPGVDQGWVAKTTEQLEAIKFGFAKARLQQPPYFVQKDEATGQPQLADTIEAFVTQAVLLIEASEATLRQQHKQITQARLEAPAGEQAAATAQPSSSEALTEESDSKPKRSSLHAAFFRRKVSTPPVKFAKKGDSSNSPRRTSSHERRFDKRERSGPSSSKGRDFKGHQKRGEQSRPGPNQMGPVRAGAGGSRFAPKRGEPTFNYSPSASPRASHAKPKLAGRSSSDAAGAVGRDQNMGQHRRRFAGDRSASATPKLRSDAERGQRDSAQARFKPQREHHHSRVNAPSEEPALEGRWWDQPEPRRQSHQPSRSGGEHRPRPRISHGKPRGKQFGAQKFSGKSYGAKKFAPKPALRGAVAGATNTYSSGERARKAGKFSATSGSRPGSKASGRKFGDRPFAGERKFSGGGRSGRSRFQGGKPGGQFRGRKPASGGSHAAAKPLLRKKSVPQPVGQPQGDGE